MARWSFSVAAELAKVSLRSALLGGTGLPKSSAALTAALGTRKVPTAAATHRQTAKTICRKQISLAFTAEI